jgi:hypothetical protein
MLVFDRAASDLRFLGLLSCVWCSSGHRNLEAEGSSLSEIFMSTYKSIRVQDPEKMDM